LLIFLRFCFSFQKLVTICFLQSWVGIMLVKQPFFIGGIDNVEDAKGSAFGAAGMFFFTFLASILYLIRDSRRVSDIRVVEGGGGGGGSIAGGGGGSSTGGGSVSSSQHSSSGGARQEPSYAMHRTISSGSLTRRIRQTRGSEYGKVSVFEEYDESEQDIVVEPLVQHRGYLS
jgi:hypothetical protein